LTQGGPVEDGWGGVGKKNCEPLPTLCIKDCGNEGKVKRTGNPGEIIRKSIKGGDRTGGKDRWVPQPSIGIIWERRDTKQSVGKMETMGRAHRVDSLEGTLGNYDSLGGKKGGMGRIAHTREEQTQILPSKSERKRRLRNTDGANQGAAKDAEFAKTITVGETLMRRSGEDGKPRF